MNPISCSSNREENKLLIVMSNKVLTRENHEKGESISRYGDKIKFIDVGFER